MPAIDVFHLNVHEGYQTVFGLASAIMRYFLIKPKLTSSFSKLWVKTRDSLNK